MITINALLSELQLYVCNHIINKIPSHLARIIFYRHAMGFKIGKGASIHLGAHFDCAGGLMIGENSVVSQNCRLDNRGGITIGCNASISAYTIVLTADHDPQESDFPGRTSEVVIGNYVWIGTRGMILRGVTIGDGAVIVAGAIVITNFVADTIVGGVPAKF